MKTTDFYYDLPEELIAQTPVEPRSASRLLSLDRQTGAVTDGRFEDILSFLQEGDCLILNDSRVLPARIYGHRVPTGGGVEFLLLQAHSDDRWEVLAGPGKKARPGDTISFGDGLLTAQVLEILEGGNRMVKFSYEGNFYEVLELIGEMPLPPYITQKLENQERYQTVYSREIGSAAAPTAGLHFTSELLNRVRAKGVSIGFVTLHVGLGTFRPVKVDVIEEHHMHAEHYELSKETADLINETKRRGGRVFAVGTTSCRTLESVGVAEDGLVHPADGWTSIFIYPGYRFQVLDGLITNFHLPESTLIMLVSAFAGYEHTMNAYKHAVDNRYRFFSFGDAMIIS